MESHTNNTSSTSPTLSDRSTPPPRTSTKPNANIRISISARSTNSTISSSPHSTRFNIPHSYTMRGILRPKKTPSSPGPSAKAKVKHSASTSPAKTKDTIDPKDGKTKTCNRAKTFDTFVDGEQLRDEAGEAQPISHTNDVKKGLGKLLSMLGKGKGKQSGAH